MTLCERQNGGNMKRPVVPRDQWGEKDTGQSMGDAYGNEITLHDSIMADMQQSTCVEAQE